MAGGTFTSAEAMIADIQKCASDAISAVHSEAPSIENQEFGNFYASGTPKMYQRSGAMGRTGRQENLVLGGDTPGFTERLETAGIHPNADKLQTMGEVLDAAHNNPGKWKIVGRWRFWDEIDRRLGEKLDQEIGKYFS